jgi:hypothetical protein
VTVPPALLPDLDRHMIGSVDTLRFETAAAPFDQPSAGRPVADLIARAYYTGILAGPVSNRLSADLVSETLHRLQQHGFVRDLPAALAAVRSRDPRRVAQAVETILGALEESPVPETEWRAVRAVLDERLLARLVGAAVPSLRRYASGRRTTPDDVADRLHFVALLVADLAGAYNPLGIRRWFDRPRPQLGGASPIEALGDGWRPQDPAARRVRALARALVGAPAT